MKEYLELSRTTNPQIWAEKFIELIRLNPGKGLDLDFLSAWFGNAIMAGYNAKKSPQIVRLQSTENYPLGCWEIGELAEVVKFCDQGIVVRMVDQDLGRSLAQELAIALGYPTGFLVVQAQNILIG